MPSLPYQSHNIGQFTFEDDAERQIWIGGGIGITPFIARMKQQLAGKPSGQCIELFHSTTELAPEALAKLTEDAAAAQVNLHVMIDSRDGYLTGDKLRAAVPDWQTASVWFCGPAGFGTALRRDLVASGLPSRAFHLELFNMRWANAGMVLLRALLDSIVRVHLPCQDTAIQNQIYPC